MITKLAQERDLCRPIPKLEPAKNLRMDAPPLLKRMVEVHQQLAAAKMECRQMLPLSLAVFLLVGFGLGALEVYFEHWCFLLNDFPWH